VARFKYRASALSGEIIEGEIEAVSISAVAESILDHGHVPILAWEIKSSDVESWQSWIGLGEKPLTRKELEFITRELSSFLNSGLLLEKSLEILIDIEERPSANGALSRILLGIRGGRSFADTLSAQPKNFPRYYVNLIKAGESSGTLDKVMARLADYIDKSNAIREQIISALIYPALLLSLIVIALVLMLTFVLPRFQPIFENSGVALPWPTQVTLAIGQIVQSYWWLIPLPFVSGVLLIKRLLKIKLVRYRVDHFLLNSPLLFRIFEMVETERFCRTTGTLIANGVMLSRALPVARESISNVVMEEAVRQAEVDIKEGGRLSSALTRSGVFPKLALQFIRVGEESGRLDEMLLKVAERYDRMVDTTLTRLLALLVPVVTILMGLLVAGFIGSILLGIISVNQLAL